MTEGKRNLSPDTEETAPKMDYNDLKYPLLMRGIPVPVAMEDYIRGCTTRDTLSDADIEAIRAEMLQVFQNVELNIPHDFEVNFQSWFPRGKSE